MKHIPQRTCVACGDVTSKRELVRLVRLADGTVEIDGTARKAGRGAYLCRSWQCWQDGLKGNRLEQVLHAALSQEDRERLDNYRTGL